MARPVEYDLEKVLDEAMEIFWKKGYEGVSMAELVSSTGLNRRTMYSLFKDKEGLFRDSLDNYYTKRSAKKLSILKENEGKKGIELFFSSFKFGQNFKGCLFSNSMREKECLNDETYNIPKEYFNDISIQMEINLRKAQEDNDFSGDPKSMALTLVTFIHGFHVHGKYNNSVDDGDLIIQNIIQMIR